MIEVREFARAVLRRLEPAGSAEDLHPGLVSAELLARIRYTFGGGAN